MRSGSEADPEIIFLGAENPGTARRVQRLAKAGRLRRLYAGIYTSNADTSSEDLVVRHWRAMVGYLLPEGVISHRSAFDGGPRDGRLILTRGRTKRPLKLPGLIVDVLPGPGPRLESPACDIPAGALHISSEARRFLENMTRGRGWAKRVLSHEELEAALAAILRGGGEQRMRELMAQAAIAAGELELGSQFKRLDAMVQSLLGPQSVPSPIPVRLSSHSVERDGSGNHQIETPAGDVAREATAPRRGFLYQDYLTALEWFALDDGEVLFVEVGEDYVRASANDLLAAQVKDLSRRITLNDSEARRALASFVELTQLNPLKKIRYSFITTAAATTEQRREHRASPEGSIHYWQQVQQGAEVAPLKHALLAMELDLELRKFMEKRTDDQLRDDLVARFNWLVGAAPIESLKEELTAKVVTQLRERGVERSDGKKRVANVLEHVIDLAQRKDRNDRRLDKAGLSDLLDDLATINISIRHHEELTTKAAIADHLPRSVLDGIVKNRVEALKNSRHFIGYDKITAAQNLAKDVCLPGEYTGASDDVRAMAMSWAARVLLDEQPDAAADLIDAALKLAPTSEALCLTCAIRASSDGASAGMAKLGTLDSPPAMTARYYIQRRSAKETEAIMAGIEWFQRAHVTIGEFDEDGQALILNDLMCAERWGDAISLANGVNTQACKHPSLLLNCALAALCEAAPEDRRLEVLQMPPLWDPLEFPLSATADGMAARARAVKLFQKLHEVATNLDLDAVSDHALEYLLWLKLENSPKEPSALRELEALVTRSKDWEKWIPLAISSGIAMNLSLIRQRLEQRYIRLGTHDFNSARALLATLLATGSHASAADFRTYQGQLSTHFTTDFLVSLEVQACLRDGDIAGARAAFVGLGKGPESERMRHHLEIMISKHGGEDTLTQLREEFLRTGHAFDLEQLIRALGESQQWQELAQYTREKFNRSKDVESAELHVDTLRRSSQWKGLIDFFDEYPEFAKKHGMLAGQYAQTCLFLAKWDDVQDAIRSGRLSESLARKLELQVPLLSLQWQNFNAQIDQALADPTAHSAESLLQLATVAATLGRAADSRQLTARAAAAAPDDPRILMSSFYRATKGAWDDERSAGEWLQSAIKHAGDGGVVQRKSLAELAELAPHWRERSEKAWASLQSGQIWLGAYAKWVNQQLSQITVGAAIANCVQPDVRNRSIIPAFSGARLPSPLASGKTVALDVTALMNLAYLDLLDELLDIYSDVVVPHGTGVWLFEEFQHAEFHQPRLIEEASRLLSQVAQDKIQICPKVIIEDSELASRVGVELSDLLHRAKELQMAGDAAFVICTAPVHLVDSLLEKEAELGAYDGVLRSLICLVQSLDLQGALTIPEKENALAFLRQVDRGWEGDIELPPSAVLLLDDLTVSHLQHLGLLAKLANSSFKLVIHRKLRDQAKGYDALRESGQQMHNVLTKVRDFLSEGVRSGKVGVLPVPMENWGKASELPSPTTDLFALEGKYDSILIDDRFFNRYPAFDQKDATSIPIHCTLDVIDHLRDTGKISDRERLSYRTNLRRSGYALIPVTESELTQAAASTQVLPNALRESLDLRSIREAVTLTQIRGILQLPLEMVWLESLIGGCNELLTTLLRSPADNRQNGLLAWLLALIDYRDFGEVFPGEVTPERLRYLSLALHVRLITTSMFEKRGTSVSSTVDGIFDSLLWSAPLAHRWLTEQSKRMLFDLKNQLDHDVQNAREKRHIPMVLWRGINALPASLRAELLDDELFLAKLDMPTVPELRLNTPGNPVFNRDRIWQVVSKVLHDGAPTEIEDCSGGKWCIRRNAEGSVVLDIHGVSRPLAFPDIEYMSVDAEVRVAHLSDKCAAMGVDCDQLSGSILANLRNNPLTAFDIERAQLLFERFPLPVRERLIREMRDGETTLNSLFPSDFSYYEHLIGPWRGESDVLAFASKMSPTAQDAPFDVRLLVRLLLSGHSATGPRDMIAHADAMEIKGFLTNHAPNLDIWSLTAFLEGMLARKKVIDEFGDELLQLLEAFDRMVNEDEQRMQFAALLAKAAELRIRSLSPDISLPPYWRRLAAIAHGAVAERALMSARVKLGPFQERLETLVIPYNPAGIVDMQREPTWAPFLMNGRQLQQEVLRRVLVAWGEHIESSASFERNREKFAPILRELLSHRDVASSCARGPADGGIPLYELSAAQCREMEQLLDDQGSTKPLDVWFALATAGTAALLPQDIRDRLVTSIEQVGTTAFANRDENQSGHVLAWLGFLAASSRDINLARAVIKLARAVEASAESDIPATLCLYVSAITAAAFSDRSEWQKLLVDCAEHAAYTCTLTKDAINSVAALEGFATADWQLQLPLAKARAALKGLIHKP